MTDIEYPARVQCSIALSCDKWVQSAEWVLKMVTAAMVLFIMGLTFVDVACRYLLAVPITGSSEMVKFAMAVLVFAAFPIVSYREEHISVSLLQGRLHGAAKWAQRFLVLVVSAAACAMIAWQIALNGAELNADSSVTMVLGWSLGYLNYVMSAFSALACIALLWLIAQHLGAVIHIVRGAES